MDRKQHFNKLLDELEHLSTSMKNHRNKSEEILARFDKEFGGPDHTTEFISVYDLLLKRIDTVHNESKHLVI